MKHRSIVALAALTLTAALTACGGQDHLTPEEAKAESERRSQEIKEQAAEDAAYLKATQEAYAEQLVEVKKKLSDGRTVICLVFNNASYQAGDNFECDWAHAGFR